MQEQGTGYVFADAEQALVWSAEVLRRRRLPKVSALWREVMEEAEFVARAWEGEKHFDLPRGWEERVGLALRVDAALQEVEPEAGELLRLWAWGDWADEGRLRGALAVQEKLRREGVRARICYRYSCAQLGRMMGCDRKAAWRRVQAALEMWERVLAGKGLVAGVQAEARAEARGRRVRREDFA